MNKAERPANMEQYILDHIEEALENDRIKVYVQPVVRTLTREVCGMEALSRWLDPEYGLFRPDEYIRILEKHRRIHELDAYVVRKVCEMHSRMKKQIDVPVSVNLSRLDGELCDIFEVIESAVRVNKMPRTSLCIEITESALVRNESTMRKCITKFREAGYAVWMDDFGSGYSSLNVLKDYVLDELKIDMRFLSDFNERSKKILASVVNMAKLIGIQTLAEGVENEEHFEYLRNIGCEKVQGFLFGRPMPIEECQTTIQEMGLSWETPKLRRYYDEIGQLNVLSATPFMSREESNVPVTGREMNSISLAILELRGDELRVLYVNQAFEDMASSTDWKNLECLLSDDSGIHLRDLSGRLQKLLEETRSEGDGRLFSVYNDDYYEMRTIRLAQQSNATAILVNMTNLSQIAAMDSQQELDEGLRSIYSVYEQVSLINLNNYSVVALHMKHEADGLFPTENLVSRINEYAENKIFPEDREKFKRFMDPETLEERVTRRNAVRTHLRSLTYHGAYSWKCYILLRIRENIFYLLIRDAEGDVREFQSTYRNRQTADEKLTPEILWENAVTRSDLKFFWKDRNRRFVGASRCFLDYYGFSSENDIIGKTDEDMGWHIHADPFRNEEWKVINEGIISRQAEGKCLNQGEDREIVATKMPVYSPDGEIVGLIGSFYETQTVQTKEKAFAQARTDALTGLLNSRGISEDLYAYVDEYQLRGKDFAYLQIAIDDFSDINTRYGYDFGDAVMQETGKALLNCCGNTATIGRITGCNFTVLRQFDHAVELDNLIAQIRRIPLELKEINGVPFSIYLSVGMALYSETRDRERMAVQAELRRMTDDVEGISQQQLMENTGRIFKMFDDLPIAYAVYKMIPGPNGNDAVVLYANHRFMFVTRTTPLTLIGKRVSHFFTTLPADWFSLAEQAGLEGRTVEKRFRIEPMKHDMIATAYPLIGPGFCAFTFRSAVQDENT